MVKDNVLTGDYAIKGSYHEHLDPNWKYYPVYVEKKKFIKKTLKNDLGKKILDLGCGEGVLLRELRSLGHNVVGMDYNFESEHVTRGSILSTPYENNSFDVILCLDVIEHLHPADQPEAFKEIARILRPGGRLICSLPNLAHLASRFTFFFLGRPLRTASIDRHPGDRTYQEFKKLIKSSDFSILKTKALFLTEPLICLWTLMSPVSSTFLHRIYNRLFPIPSLSFLVIYDCRINK